MAQLAVQETAPIPDSAINVMALERLREEVGSGRNEKKTPKKTEVIRANPRCSGNAFIQGSMATGMRKFPEKRE